MRLLQVIAEFRRHGVEADPARRAQNLQLAKDYNFLLQSIREHKVIRCPVICVTSPCTMFGH